MALHWVAFYMGPSNLAGMAGMALACLLAGWQIPFFFFFFRLYEAALGLSRLILWLCVRRGAVDVFRCPRDTCGGHGSLPRWPFPHSRSL